MQRPLQFLMHDSLNYGSEIRRSPCFDAVPNTNEIGKNSYLNILGPVTYNLSLCRQMASGHNSQVPSVFSRLWLLLWITLQQRYGLCRRESVQSPSVQDLSEGRRLVGEAKTQQWNFHL